MILTFKVRAFAGLLAGAITCAGQSQSLSVLGLLTPDEYRRAGLSKLTPEELQRLDASLLRIEVALRAAGNDIVGDRSNRVGDASSFFDSRGIAIAYFDDDDTLFLWSGEPVAYRYEDSLFGFNGNHLGWVHDGAIYDHDGEIVAALASRFKNGVQAAPYKNLKELKPLKGLKELKPLKPLFGISWSRTPARQFFLGGTK